MPGSNYQYVKEWRKTHKANRAEEARRYRAKHPDKVKAVKDAYRLRNRETRLPIEAAQAAERRRKDPVGDKRRREAFKERKCALQEKMMGRPRPLHCEVCGESGYCRGRSPYIVFDHDHATGMPRGWLCDRCNKVLGMVKDRRDLLFSLSAYLEKNDGKARDKTAEILTLVGVRPPKVA